MRTKTFLLIGVLGFLAACHSQKSETGLENREFTFRSNDSTQLYVKVSGEGPPCIFVHGGPGAWSGSFERMGGRNLESDLTMIYYDQRGSGRSGNSSNYALNRMVEDIEEIREYLGADKIFLMAHSFGGIIATKYAEVHPQNLHGLILVNSTLNLSASLRSQIGYMNQLTNASIDPDGGGSLLEQFAKARTKLDSMGQGYKMLTDDLRNFQKLDSIDKSCSCNHDFAQKVWAYPEYHEDISQISTDINIPTLTITGNSDHAIGVDHYSLFKFPKNEVAKLEGTHLLYYENNEEFLKRVISFVNRTPDL